MEIICGIIVAIIQSILFFGNKLGISVLLFEIIVNGIIYYILYKENKIQNKNGIFLMIPILLLSSTYFIFANKAFHIANIFVLVVLNLLMYVLIINPKDYFKSYICRIFALLSGTIEEYKEGIDYTKEKTSMYIKKSNKLNRENIKKLCLSLIIVFAIVGVVIALLISADSIFANLFSGIRVVFEKLNYKSVFTLILRLIIIVIVYFLFVNLILKLKESKVQEKELKETNNKYKFTVKLLLILLNIIYIVFCYIQIQALFAKINISGNFNYANYARTGFFQLMAVSFINFIIILISNKYDEKLIKICNLMLVIDTIIIAISSMYRMYMYETEYGLTYLRIFVYIILAYEIISFIPIIIYIFNKKFDFVKWCFIIGICIYCIINYMGIEKIIINKNINRVEASVETDYEYISSIASEDSYDILEQKLKKEENTDSEKLQILNTLMKIKNNSKELKWQEFNISKLKVYNKEIDEEKIQNEIQEIQARIKTSNEVKKSIAYCIYNEVINANEQYIVDEHARTSGSAQWRIIKVSENSTKYELMSTIGVTTPSKVKFFENGLGFIEMPTSIYCGKADLLVTHDYGKNFEKIEFPIGKFTLSDSNGKKWQNCYDYFYLPTKDEKGVLTVLASGGYEGGYNDGKTRAKYISNDNGYTWQFVDEIWK